VSEEKGEQPLCQNLWKFRIIPKKILLLKNSLNGEDKKERIFYSIELGGKWKNVN
jgi:hypothetical protein